MQFLSAQQLAFILDIKVQEAKDKIIYAYCKDKGWPVPLLKKENKKDRAEYPNQISIALLAKYHNLPTLQSMVDDINDNYLTRKASKKWILCDYPEKLIAKWVESGEKHRLTIPPGLKSMLKNEDVIKIMDEWRERHPGYNGEIAETAEENAEV